MKKSPQNTAIVLLPSGAFGGAEKRFVNLFLFFNRLSPGSITLIINSRMYEYLQRIMPAAFEYKYQIEVIGEKLPLPQASGSNTVPRYYKDTIPDPVKVDSRASYLRKVYWYFKNKRIEKKLFAEIEKIKQRREIKVFIGVFAGVLPLVFYMNNRPGSPAVIFSNMDSWFSDVLTDMKTMWYRKYYSFNYAMENSDIVDFLSPYIAEGVEKRNVNIPGEKIAIAPCSFADYSKCTPGKKVNIEIAFSGRMEPDKNPMLYLKAAREILKTRSDVTFHVMGEGSLVNEVSDFIAQNDLSDKINFRFHPNPPEVLAETSLFVSLQTGTNYPSQSILEAMACGNAIIASNTGDTGLFINSANGVLVELELNDIVKALTLLINDNARTKKMGEAARTFALQNHTIEKAADYYIGLIEKAGKK
ncbi:MAG: glycosyltransferase family 4 protein [Ignavibacteria bacterium]|nr:glycosyltransferase family 4 protein [Ignavibacteria bacterium]